MVIAVSTEPFWQTKSFSEMSDDEWESLCDRCGRCCVQKMEDEETGEVYYTNLACTLFNQELCVCSDYQNRLSRVPNCLKLERSEVDKVTWLPKSCAYRRLAEGRPLAQWHPLLSGSYQSVVDAGISVKGRVTSEANVPESRWEDHIIHWIDC